jgi:DNA polymerase III alpha subunit (gram-positive type)
MPKIFISFDIETDFKHKLLNIGWCKSINQDEGKEYFIWQNEKFLYYDNNCDKKYIKILNIWRPAEKTPIGQVLTEFKKDTDGKIIVGWNIKCFDIPILRKYFQKYLDIDWRPSYFDGYECIRELIKKDNNFCHKLMKVNGLTPSGMYPKMSAEAMFKYFTGCFGYEEWHTALYDAQDERHLIKAMHEIGVSPFKRAKIFEPSKKNNPNAKHIS